jgi:serine/threonine-protein kinase
MKYCPICNTKYDDSMSFCTRDGEVLQDDPTSIVGTTLDGQYAIEAMLGKGGMGAVYRARHILLGDKVAIKILPTQMRNNTEWLRRFQREGQAARRFRHPNAVTVYDLRTTNDRLIYMVMEFVEGRTLDQELRIRGKFTPRDALAVLEPVMNALNAAHAVGVVHRDIKPENIMIGRAQTGGETTVKLLDLGIAKLAAGDEASGTGALTVAGQLLGTPHYMSPEQWGEIPRDGDTNIDGRADIYSLGAVVYQLVSGKRPFSGLTLSEVRREHISTTPQPLNEITTDVPEGFSRAVMRALSKDRNDRQATADELSKELRAGLGLSQSENLSAFQPIVAHTGSHPSPTENLRTNPNESVSRTNAPTEVLSSDTIGDTDAIQSDTMADLPFIQTPQSMSLPPTTASPPIVTPPPSQPSTLPIEQGSAPSYQQTPSQSLPPTSMANVESLDLNVNQTLSVNVAPPIVTQPVAPPKKSSSKAFVLIPIFGIGLLFLVAALGIGGYIFRDKIFPTASPSPNPSPNSSPNVSGSPDVNKTPIVIVGGEETVRYWFDVLQSEKGDTVRLANEPTVMKSGQSFKFNFIPREDGYLYIIGSGQNGALTTFLTNKPVKETGVDTNKIIKGKKFVFPSGEKNWIGLDENIGLEKYTVILSPVTLTSPTLFTAEAGTLLNEAEKKQLNGFLEKYNANKADLSVKNAETNEPFVVVKASVKDELIIFVITIDHR